jgi:uncharacterized membrane protein
MSDALDSGETEMNGLTSDRAAVARPRVAPYGALLGLLAVIAALQLITAPSLVAALVAPDLGHYLSEPLRGSSIAQSYFIPSIAAVNLALLLYMLHRPASLRRNFLLGTLVAAGCVVLAVLFVDRGAMASEASKLAHFTAAVLSFPL